MATTLISLGQALKAFWDDQRVLGDKLLLDDFISCALSERIVTSFAAVRSSQSADERHRRLREMPSIEALMRDLDRELKPIRNLVSDKLKDVARERSDTAAKQPSSTYRNMQKRAAEQRRALVTPDGKGIKDICWQFFSQHDCSHNWKVLWKLFIKYLADLKLKPKQAVTCCKYFDWKGKEKSISEGSFRRHLSDFRR